MHLGAKVNWFRIFNDLVKNFDEETLSKKQNIALLKAGLKQTI